MVINKIKLMRGPVIFEANFTNGTNIIEASDNQLGKTTIIYSILYAFGAKDLIFNDMDKKPEIIKVWVEGKEISRTNDEWTCNGEYVSSGDDIAGILNIDMPIVRAPGGSKKQNIISFVQYMLLQQKRLDLSRGTPFKKHISVEMSDTNVSLKGFENLNELVNVSEEINENRKKNNKISNNIKLNEYIINEKVNLGEFKTFHEKITKNNSDIRSTYTLKREVKKMIHEFDDETMFMKSVSLFIDRTLDASGLTDDNKRNELVKFLEKEFRLRKTTTNSISDIEKANLKINNLDNRIKLLKSKNKKLEFDAVNLIDSSGLERKIITYAIAKKIDKDLISNKKLLSKIKIIKKSRDVFLNKLKQQTNQKMMELGIQRSDSGLGQLAEFIIERTFWKNELMIPLIIDSAKEVATDRNFTNKILIPAKSFGGQIIMTTIKTPEINFDENEYNIIKITKPIFGD